LAREVVVVSDSIYFARYWEPSWTKGDDLELCAAQKAEAKKKGDAGMKDPQTMNLAELAQSAEVAEVAMDEAE
jgi:hypothetical protein